MIEYIMYAVFSPRCMFYLQTFELSIKNVKIKEKIERGAKNLQTFDALNFCDVDESDKIC